MSIVPLPTARPVMLREQVAAAPEEEQCGSLARGLTSWFVPGAGTVSCVRARGHDGEHSGATRAMLGRFWLTYRW
jgi:hypothetical protein